MMRRRSHQKRENGGVRGGWKRLLSLMLAGILAAVVLPWETIESQASETQLENPRIVNDSSMEAGQKVTWDCVYFGSYPQAEVITSEMEKNYTALDSSLRTDGDVVVSDDVYESLTNATDWDENGDIMLDGTKYRRMKKGDATYSSSYNWSDSSTYHYFQYEPIKWRVLDTGGGDALLLSDVALDDQRYNTEDESVTWKISTIRSWLNGYGASVNQPETDYSGSSFIGSAFSSSEEAAIQSTALKNANNIRYETDGGGETTDRIFLLSDAEVYTDDAIPYGFVSSRTSFDEGRMCQSSTYAKAMGTGSSTETSYLGNCWWWLRTPGSNAGNAAFVRYYGSVYDSGWGVNGSNAGVRPALNLNLSSNQWSYAGTVSSDGTENEEWGGDNPGTGSDGEDTSDSSTATAQPGAGSPQTSQNTQISNRVDNGSGITLSKDNLKLKKKGKTYALKVNKKNNSKQTVTVKSNKKSIIQVKKSGKGFKFVSGGKKGKVKITVTVKPKKGKKVTRKFTVVVK